MNLQQRVLLHVDKVQHLLGGIAITVVVGGLLHPLAGQAACLLAAWFKEERDRKHPERHTRDGWDAYATAFGMLPGGALLEWGLPALAAAIVRAMALAT